MSNNIKICLDSGHSGKNYNQSTQVPDYYESEMAWQLHLLLKSELEEFGFAVSTTRQNQNEDPEVYTRGTLAKDCDMFLSIHSNACGTESVDYPMVYHAYDNKNQAETFALALATAIGETMKTVQVGKTGTRTLTNGGEYYGVMRGARAVDVPLYFIVEHSFHTNKNASLWLLEEENLRLLAKNEAKLIADYYNINNVEDTSGYTRIMGDSIATVEQMEAFLMEMKPEATDFLPLAEYFYKEGKVEGVRGDIAFAQACLETGYFSFGGDVSPEQNNFCGLGATGNGEAGCAFDTMELGARAQIQHLHAYASTENLFQVTVDPRYSYVERGCVPFVEWLGIQENPNHQGWAAGANYGEKILAILEKIINTEVEIVDKSEETTVEIIPDWMKNAVEWMVEQELLCGDGQGNLRVNDPLTRGEFSVILYQYYNKLNQSK